ncbi:MAG: glutaredoxin family protein [Minisyncoccia bacterium]
MKIKVYTAPGCPYCFAVKEFLQERGIQFEEIDVSQNEEALIYIIEKTQQYGVPVIEIDGEFIIGFDRERLIQILSK